MGLDLGFGGLVGVTKEEWPSTAFQKAMINDVTVLGLQILEPDMA